MSPNIITMASGIDVEKVQHWGSDQMVCQAARVSAARDHVVSDPERDRKLIKLLLAEGHHVPFEHCGITFRIEAPIFVIRHLVKHRIASMSELSGRYAVMKPKFYTPSTYRPLTQEGNPMEYNIYAGGGDQDKSHYIRKQRVELFQKIWDEYIEQVNELGVPREVAREILPLAMYSSVYFTINLRSLFNLLQLRTARQMGDEDSTPQLETAMMARKMEDIFANHFPMTYDAFVGAYGQPSE